MNPLHYSEKAVITPRKTHEEWYILSPKHYVLDPDGPPIEPYDETLTDTGIDERRVLESSRPRPAGRPWGAF